MLDPSQKKSTKPSLLLVSKFQLEHFSKRNFAPLTRELLQIAKANFYRRIFTRGETAKIAEKIEKRD